MTTPVDSHLILGPVLTLGPGLGIHPSRQGFKPGSNLQRMRAYTSVADVLLHRARTAPEAEALFFLDIEDRLSTLTNAGLLAQAQRAAVALARRGVGRGDRVFLCFDTGPELLSAFFGCSLLGAVPLMSEPLVGFARTLSWQERARKMLADAEVKAMVVDEALLERAVPVAASRGGLPILGPKELLEPLDGALPDVPALRPDELAFIQFSSGTTSDTKGVMVTNQSLVTNVRSMGERARFRDNEMNVGWLPLHHDMGLVGTVLTPLFFGQATALMPPVSFIFKPQRWLWALHYFRGNCSYAPNFAYQLCVNKIPEEELRGMDLSAWRLAHNGAEFIDSRTVQRFHQRFSPCGFRSNALFPVYGMAELTLAATFPDPDAEPRLDVISRERLSEQGEAVPVAVDDPSGLTLVGVGQPFPDHAVKIVDADGVELPERRQGQILLKGASLAVGYVNQPELSAESFRDGWLWTGDLGYMAEGELFISGRIKDLIIRGGRNYHPYAFEIAAAQVKGCRPGCVAAFGAYDPESGTEQIFVVCETSLEEGEQITVLRKQVEKAVYDATGLRPDRVLPVPPRTLPKTSSGKLQRGRIREIVLSGKLPTVPPRA